jgi:Aspartate/tyrosine/aromatic aminotransferase
MSFYSRRVATFGTTIFTEINGLAQQYNALNLGQGRPDFDTPPDIIEQVTKVLHDGQHNQYAPGSGTAELRQAVADHARRFRGLDIDPVQGVVVTSGATEGLLACILGLVDPGDEVIVIEPFYDCYVPDILMAGATPVFVPLHPPTWTFDEAELRAAFTKKTRALIINSPHNPTGRVFTHAELQLLAELCCEYDVTVILDEVYEHLTLGETHYEHMATLPGMFERTVAVSSSGKAFSATGWKIGWVYGHPDLVEGVARAHQFITFAVHHPTQLGIAYALNLPDSYYQQLKAMYDAKVQLLMQSLAGSGLQYSQPQGTYFILANFADVFSGASKDFARFLIQQIGVACIPLETMYSAEHVHIGKNYARFSFCKTDDALLAAREPLAKLRQYAHR